MGKGGDGKKVGKKKEVLINEKMYDITGFRHPGGSVINFLAYGGDATDTFIEFHGHSPSANKYLVSLPSRQATEEELRGRREDRYAKLSTSYQKLRADLKAKGHFEPSVAHVLYRLAEIAIMHIVGIYILMNYPTPLGVAGALLMLGVVQGRCGWLMHEAGHYSYTKVPALDRVLQIFLYGVGCGMSAGWWRSQHNRHHAAPQKLHHDVDLETMPLVSFNHRISARIKNPILKAWLRLQGILFFPVICTLVSLGWQFFLHPRYMQRTGKYMEFLSLVIRYVGWFGFVTQGWTWGQAWALYVAYVAVGGSYIFTNFALSHTHLPVTSEDEYIHWAEYAVNHTTNITPHPGTNWWMSYLNFQIEHHLFPQMPQYHMPKVAPQVRAWCKENGLQYDERDYFSCFADTLKNLHDVGASAGADAGKKKAA
eukprot:Hpha_TRINITY_DN10654_c0_g1::TRINITY_DN10654_c0_g1_i1::g.156694::m.156694